jgi:hypothetical protein
LAPFLKGRRKLGPAVLGLWLVASGLAQLIHLNFLFMGTILAVLAIAAGTLIWLDR